MQVFQKKIEQKLTKVDQNLLQRIQYNYDMVGVCWWPNDHCWHDPPIGGACLQRNFPAFFWHSDVCKQARGQLGIQPHTPSRYLPISDIFVHSPIASQPFPIFAARRVFHVQIRAMIWIQSICHKKEPYLPVSSGGNDGCADRCHQKHFNPHLATKPHLNRENASNDNCT